MRTLRTGFHKDKGQQVENQLCQLREFATRNGWTIVAEYIDQEAGKISDLEQYQTMFDAPSKRQFDFCCSGRSTGYRGKVFCPRAKQYFDSCGIFRDAVIAIVATVAKQERIRISERVKPVSQPHATKATFGPSPGVVSRSRI